MKNLGTISLSRLNRIDKLSQDRQRQFYMAYGKVKIEKSNKIKEQTKIRAELREKYDEVFELLDKLEWEDSRERNRKDEKND